MMKSKQDNTTQQGGAGAGRRKVAGLFHWIAFFWVVLAVEVLIFGGIRYDLGSGMLLSATHVVNPIAFAVVATLIGWLLAPHAPLRQIPIWRSARFLMETARQVKTPRRALIALAIVVAVSLGLSQQARQKYHEQLGDLALTAGQDELAAQHYRRAIGWLDPSAHALRQKAAYAFSRAGRFEEAAGEIEDLFNEGDTLTNKGYRALWRSYRALGRYQEALAVVERAIGDHPSLGREASSVLAQLKREVRAAGAPEERIAVRLQYRSLAPISAPYLVGSWSARTGKRSEIYGWQPVAMVSDDDGIMWHHDIELAIETDFPYVAVVQTSADVFAASPEQVLAAGQFWADASQDADAASAETASAATAPAATAPAETAPGVHGPTRVIELLPLPEGAGMVPPAARRKPGADGHRRVVALWPDAGSWFLTNALAHRGLMPNVARLMQNGLRGEMLSTHPPFTSTAYVRMVELDPGMKSAKGRLLSTWLIQLKGIPFLDALIPDSLVTKSEGGPTIFSVLSEHGLRSVNLVFSDRYVAAPQDLQTGDGKMIKLDSDALIDDREEDSISEDDAEWVVRDLMHVSSDTEPRRAARMRNETVFLLGVANTEHKAQAGLATWNEQQPDFMLLRFPSVDILSHRYFSKVLDHPHTNVMQETYRHLDEVIGRFVAQLDEDDTLIFVSDHGIQSTLLHHRSCLLVVEGPGMAPGSTLDTIPIGHFPSVVLSRFQIEAGADRLTPETRALLFPAAAAATATQGVSSGVGITGRQTKFVAPAPGVRAQDAPVGALR